jgi:hypothetical protein
MSSIKKVATNIPEALLKEAVSLSGLTQTGALIEGLKELILKKRREEFLSLAGSMKFKGYSVTTMRQRKSSR